MHVYELAAKATRVAMPIPAQSNQIAVKADHAAELFRPRPVEGVLLVEPAILQKLLALEEQGDTGRCQDQGRPQAGAFLGEPTVRAPGPDFFGDTRSAVGIFVVRFGIDHPLEGVSAIAVCESIPHREHIPGVVMGGDDGGADGVHEAGVPLAAKTGPAGTRLLGEPFVVPQIFGYAYLGAW